MLYVITGPPAAGKTTWAMAKAGRSDVVIDYDRIAVALAGPLADSHDHPALLKKVAHKARYAAIAEALDRCEQGDIYLIHSMPSAGTMARYASYRARIVTIDPGRATVEDRCRALRPAMLAVVGKWYAWHARQGQAPAAQAPRPPAEAGSPPVNTTSRAW